MGQLESMVTKGTLLHATLAGSRAYGLDTPTSDVDVRGFFIAPRELFLGLFQAPEQFSTPEPDVVLYEVGKFMRLAANSNPAALEILFCEDVLFSSPEAQRVIASRDLFLSQRARERYVGYARSQLIRLEKLLAGEEATDRFQDRTRDKHIRHIFRLLDQGHQLIETGTLKVRVADGPALTAMAQLPLVEIQELFRSKVDALDALESPLPLAPDMEALSRLLVSLRN